MDIDKNSARNIWECKRRITTIICVCYHFIYGIDTTAVAVSLLFYLNDYFNPNTANTMYSVILFVGFATSFFGGIIGKISDKARNLKLIMFILLIIISIGNLMYTWHFSISFLIIGRFLVGFGNPLRSVIAGELSRLYQDQNKLGDVLFIYCTAFSFGYMIGPATPILFINVYISIGEWHITKDNFIGIAMTSFMLILSCSTLLGVHNLSKDAFNVESKGYKIESDIKLLSLGDIVTDIDVMLLIINNTLLFFVAGSLELVVILVGRNILKMDMQHLSISILISLLLCMFFMFYFWRKLVSGGNYLRGLQFCLWIGCFALLILLFITYIEVQSTIAKCVCIIPAYFASAIVGIPTAIATQGILFRIVPKHSACFVDNIRSSVGTTFGFAAGSLLASTIYQTFYYSSVVIGVVIILFSIPLYIRRDVIHKRMDVSTK